MVRKDVVEYIENEIKKGIHIDLIKHGLLQVGHDLKVVEEAIRHVHGKNRLHVHLNRYVIPIVLIIVLIGIALFLKHQAPESLSLVRDEVEEKLVGDVGAEEQQTVGEAGVEEQSPEQAGADEGPSDADWFNRALEEDDASFCDNIQDGALRANCEGVFAPAVETPVNPDSELFNNALADDDVILCDNIQDEDLKNGCKNAFASAPEEDSTDDDTNWFNNAMTEDDASLCGNIQDEALRANCKSAF